MTARTLADKVWDAHVVDRQGDRDLLYVDLHLVHEVTSPQAFSGLRISGRRVRRPDLTVATADHDVPTDPSAEPDPAAQRLLAAEAANCAEFDIALHGRGAPGQGIVHVIGPETGLTQPGMTVVCGDSHTSTHGAFGAIGLGIGTSQVEHVLATQTVRLAKPRNRLVVATGRLSPGSSAKDLALAVIAAIGTSGGTGAIVELAGDPVTALAMSGRMTVCNMAVEAGARTAIIAPDDTTFAELDGLDRAPSGDAWDEAVAVWRALASDPGAPYDRVTTVDASAVGVRVTWGTTPAQNTTIGGVVPEPSSPADERALAYQGLTAGTPLRDIAVDTVFIGSCTNSRLDDLRAAAAVAEGRRVAPGVRALVVPGSRRVQRAAEAEGLDEVFRAAGFEWRDPGCSMCVGMNGDALRPGERCASTSNRNYEGRQGPGGRTHLVAPATAAATAIVGHLAAAADLD